MWVRSPKVILRNVFSVTFLIGGLEVGRQVSPRAQHHAWLHTVLVAHYGEARKEPRLEEGHEGFCSWSSLRLPVLK